MAILSLSLILERVTTTLNSCTEDKIFMVKFIYHEFLPIHGKKQKSKFIVENKNQNTHV